MQPNEPMPRRDQDALLGFFFYTALLMFAWLMGMPGMAFVAFEALGVVVLYWDWFRRQPKEDPDDESP